jgi:K+-sensing histidine kinase KdpD
MLLSQLSRHAVTKKSLEMALALRRKASKVPNEIRKKYAEPAENTVTDASERLAAIIKNIRQAKGAPNDNQ